MSVIGISGYIYSVSSLLNLTATFHIDFPNRIIEQDGKRIPCAITLSLQQLVIIASLEPLASPCSPYGSPDRIRYGSRMIVRQHARRASASQHETLAYISIHTIGGER